jgi:DNA-binding GntR family transcriptional regulator
MTKPSFMVPVKARSLVDGITAQLEAAIISGQLAPGTKISEQGLARELKVSRGPLREAIRRLEGRKLIERTVNIGARIAKLSVGDLHDLLIVREALEGIACRYAATAMSDEEIDALKKLLEQHGRQTNIRKGVGYYQEAKDFDFHFQIIKGSKNKRLVDMLCGELYDLLRLYRYKSSTREGRTKAAYLEHKRIVDALFARNPDEAENAMRQHIRNARTYIEQGSANDGDADIAPITTDAMPLKFKRTLKRVVQR